MEPAARDLLHAVRGLLRRPVFTLVAVGSLALGIGATTSIFSVANALLLRAAPGVTGSGLVELGRTDGGRGFDTFAYPELEDIRLQVGALDQVSAWSIAPVSFSTGDEGERITAVPVSANYFETLGVPPGHGRYFVPEEDRVPGGHPVVVLSHDFWQERFGGDPAVLGTTLALNRTRFTVVGVAPEGFRGHSAGIRPQVWVPFMMQPVVSPGWDDFRARNASNLLMIGRLAPGADVAEADAAVRTVFARLQDEYPDMYAQRGNERSARVIPLGPVPGSGRSFVAAFVGALSALVAMVLLITCANVAGMLLARAAAREKEIALRLALGSGRRRLVGLLLTESLVLFGVGGGLGLILADGLLNAASAVQLNTFLPLSVDVRADGRVFLFAAVATLATGVLFGLAPALRATALELVPSLKSDGHRGMGRGGRLRQAFVTAQVGLSLVLLVAAGLFVRSLQRAAAVDTGFDADGVYLTGFDLSLEGYATAEEGRDFQARLLERVRAMPGVASATIATDLPLDLASWGTAVRPDGWTSPGGTESMRTDLNHVTTGYFTTLGIPVLQGRAFSEADGPGAEPVAVVSETFAREAWPGRDPLGRTIEWAQDEGATLTVVGVVPDVKNQTVTEVPDPMLYVPQSQSYNPTLQLVVRGRPGADIAGSLTDQMLALDPRLSMTPVSSLASHTAVATLPQRIGAWITSTLGAVALFLSGLGVYGVIAFAVSRRTREIGIRMALGAEARTVARMVMGSAVRMAAPGLVVGAVLAAVLGTVLRSFLLGVSPFDPVTLIGVAGLLAALVAASAWMPARRAAAVNPVVALRSD